ncbi:DDE-type integrase/transposase/recombinase [Streptomyces sp. NPDC000410]|uniref:DDE-type integrase/transposase/recombinase n=1 Tax=Streptomyces sp. NPDC000410 TaxID=3154254 RepID=UPI003331576D
MGEAAVTDPAALVGVISDQRTAHNVPHSVSCRALGVSGAWFYKWRRRSAEPTIREVSGARLEERITYIFRRPGDTYGSPRITLDLWAEGWKVFVDTVAGDHGRPGAAGPYPPRRRRSSTRQGRRRAARDLVSRHFDAVSPNVLWVGDTTEVDTGEGKLYLATVIDAFSRRLLGCAMGAHHDASLVAASLDGDRHACGGAVDGVIFQSDRGSAPTRAAGTLRPGAHRPSSPNGSPAKHAPAAIRRTWPHKEGLYAPRGWTPPMGTVRRTRPRTHAQPGSAPARGIPWLRLSRREATSGPVRAEFGLSLRMRRPEARAVVGLWAWQWERAGPWECSWGAGALPGEGTGTALPFRPLR